MRFHDTKLALFRSKLLERGHDIKLAFAELEGGQKAPVTIRFPSDVLGEQSLVVVPDVHLSDGTDADIFLDGETRNAERLASTLQAILDYQHVEKSTTSLQVGDWYDVWRAIGSDATAAQYSRIENVPAYQSILALDAQLSLAHTIGNHDASFTHALPNRRVAQRGRFRFGFGLLGSQGRIYALHGHQVDRLTGEPNEPDDLRAVWLGTVMAQYTSKFRDLQEFIDKQGMSGIGPWLTNLLGLTRNDPTPSPRKGQASPSDGEPWAAEFVEREDMASLVSIAIESTKRIYREPNRLELLIVGHSHKPCVGWTPHPNAGTPVVVIDAGSWVYGAAQILFGAGDTVSVFDVV